MAWSSKPLLLQVRDPEPALSRLQGYNRILLKHRVYLLFLVRLALAGALVALAGAGCARHPEECWVCEREIHPHMRAAIALAGGGEVAACCPRCALHYRDESKEEVRAIGVSDYASGAPLPLEGAWLVEGSDETPCLHHPPVVDETRTPMQVCYDRCMPSLIAFRDEAAARAFQSEHGGSILAPGTLPSPSEPR